MNTALARTDDPSTAYEAALIKGDLATLNPDARLAYYKKVCETLDLNPLTRPFDYITLNGKLTLYARKDATEQLRKKHNVSITIVAREVTEDCYVVTARATMPTGRQDESIGAVPIGSLKGENRANAMMKAETKAKRRVTLSICGLGMLDETEVESIPDAVYPHESVEANRLPEAEQEAAKQANPQSYEPYVAQRQVDVLNALVEELALTPHDRNRCLERLNVKQMNRLKVSQADEMTLLMYRLAVAKLLAKHNVNLDAVREYNSQVVAERPDQLAMHEAVAAWHALNEWQGEAVPV